MKREHFSLTAIPAEQTPDGPASPTLRITYSGVETILQDRLTDDDGTTKAGEDLDVAYRKREDGPGVLSIADRLTGGFVCELEADSGAIDTIVEAAETHDERYRVEIEIDDDPVAFQKRALLVYDTTGQLLQSCSLIPGSVEL